MPPGWFMDTIVKNLNLNNMTFYMILQLFPNPKGWYPITDDPLHYIVAKKKMQELKKQNSKEKYRLIKTSY